MDEKDSTFQDLGDNDELQHIMDEIDTLEKGFDEEEKFIISPKNFDIMTLKKNVSDDLVRNESTDTSNVSIAKSEECVETVKAVDINQKTEVKNPVF